MREQQELRARVLRYHIGADVAQDVVVPQQNGAVYLRFTLPRAFVSTEEYLDGYILAMPNATPHATIPTPANRLNQRHLFA